MTDAIERAARVIAECGPVGCCSISERDAKGIAQALSDAGMLDQGAELARLRGLIRECRLADAYAARTGNETRWDHAFHALCLAERPLPTPPVEREG